MRIKPLPENEVTRVGESALDELFQRRQSGFEMISPRTARIAAGYFCSDLPGSNNSRNKTDANPITSPTFQQQLENQMNQVKR